jgi:hypothetical protein
VGGMLQAKGIKIAGTKNADVYSLIVSLTDI